MERRKFLKIAAGVAAGVAALAATAQAAPLMPHPLNEDAKLPENPAQPAVTSKEEADQLQPAGLVDGFGEQLPVTMIVVACLVFAHWTPRARAFLAGVVFRKVQPHATSGRRVAHLIAGLLQI